MRKKFFYGMLVLCVLAVSGCASLPKKFIRKKPKPEHTPSVVYVEQGPYQKKYSNEYYYKTHYTLWKTWQDEILSNLGGNAKKVSRSSEEAYSHLEQMGRYLKPEKQAELKPLIDELGRYMHRFQEGRDSRPALMALKSDLDTLRRRVNNDFYYDKVKADLLPDTVDLGSGPKTA